MEKNHIETDKVNGSNDHLGFYLEHEISPVHQNISNLSKHMERRNSLYRYLGLPKGYFSGKKILEVGPASGHNSLYIAACNPDKFDLLEPNPVAFNEIQKLYEVFKIPHSTPNVISKTLENFEKDQTYDIVICEAWLGISDYERKLMKKLGSFVKKEGILITTLASPAGYFFNMIRRLFANQLFSEFDNLEKKSEKLLMAFSSHLRTLKDMTCPHIDWVQDSLLNPGFLTMHPDPTMFFEDLGNDYSIYNSYPRFNSDWRWYKSLYEEKKKFNKVFIDNFLKNIHNFLDYRFVFDQRSSMLNAELEQLCFEFKNVVTMFEDQKNNNSISQAVVIIDKVKQNIASLKSPLEKSIDEVLNVIKTNKIDTETISQMKYFKKCFGRELFYVSVLRDN
tara:strand:- start:1278 stop:2456 length:1179 start_codon:yes stop_codon:yes gene_type:complete